MVLQLARVHLVLRVVRGVLVQVWEEDGLAIGGFDVLARAAVAVPARADFVVEGAVYFIGFGAEDAGEVVGHRGRGSCGEGENENSKAKAIESLRRLGNPCALLRVCSLMS